MAAAESLAGRWTEPSELIVHREVPAPAPRPCEAALPGVYVSVRRAGTLVPRHQPDGTVNNRPPVPNTTPPESPPLMGKLRHGEK